MFKPGDQVMYGGRQRTIKYAFDNDGGRFDGYGLVPIPGLSQEQGHNDNQAWASELQPINMKIGDTVFYQGKPRVITDISPCMNYKLNGEWITGTPEPYKYKIGDKVYWLYNNRKRQETIESYYNYEDNPKKGYYFSNDGWMPEDKLFPDTEPQIRVGDIVKFNFSVCGQVTAIHGSGTMCTIMVNLPKDVVEKV